MVWACVRRRDEKNAGERRLKMVLPAEERQIEDKVYECNGGYIGVTQEGLSAVATLNTSNQKEKKEKKKGKRDHFSQFSLSSLLYQPCVAHTYPQPCFPSLHS